MLSTWLMNHPIITTWLVAASLSAMVAGCAVEETVVVRGPRPPDRVDIVTVRPSPAHVWVRGQWVRRGDGWVWIGGRWSRS